MELLLIHMILYTFSPFVSVSLSYASEATTMSNLRASLSPSPPSSWTTSDSFCTWSGVECDTSSHVTSINLASKSLFGTLPSKLTSLSHLTTLSLQSNHFNGPIPLLSNLNYLREIHLDSNSFSSISTDTFMNLPGLQTLTLGHNPSLSPWEFPSFSNSPNFTIFEAVNTSMTGSFPSLFWVPNLRVLRLSHNQLTGTIWKESGYNLKLETLWLDHQETGLSGVIDFLTVMTNLVQVWLNNNAFSGPIPDLSNCTSIFDLQLSDNQLLGFVPNSLSSLPNLLNISLQNNTLYGPYPNFSTRVKLDIGNNANEFCSDKPGEPCDKQVITLLHVMESLGNPTNLMEAWRGKDSCKWSFIGCDNDGNITKVNFDVAFDGIFP